MAKSIEQLSIDTIRSLCIDEINKANSGHPGMALGSAPIMYTLFTKHLVATPKEDKWINRDRFVLSAGHASSLLYAMLHLSGYNLSIDDLKNFRQLGSKTPGHPEVTDTEGVDATSGPLGQGIATAVGMALAESMLRASYPNGEELVNHYTYCLCGDGCLHEGISQESISFAGHNHLNKLILFYDANEVTLDGPLSMSFTEDVKARFLASEWDVIEVNDGNDIDAINAAIIKAKASEDKPTLIMVHTVIGYGSSKAGTSKVHGNPLGLEDGEHTKKEVYGFDHEDFYVPQEVYTHFGETFITRGSKAYREHEQACAKYAMKHPEEYAQFLKCKENDIDSYIKSTKFEYGTEPVATRKASSLVLNAFQASVPNMYGGCADVAGSVLTKVEGATNYDKDNRNGHNINFGIREFAMSAIQNGMLLHGGVRSYVGCFLVFADYLKSAARMSSISKVPAIYLFSHDSIAVGEDGPTHQPIDQLAMLRSIPNFQVIRPADVNETYGAWEQALLSKETPTAIILSRQNLPMINSSREAVAKGAYVVLDNANADVEIIATGSEVSLAIDAAEVLLNEGVKARVISMPSMELFEKQPDSYKESVITLPYEKRVSLEMLSTFGWAKYAKHNIGLDSFGASGPAKNVLAHFGFTKENIAKQIKEMVK